MTSYKLTFYVPASHLEEVKMAVFEAGAGRLGCYENCAWQVKGEGQFKALAGSNPFIGQQGELEKVVEYKVEMQVQVAELEAVVTALKQAHPYETPAYDVIRLEPV